MIYVAFLGDKTLAKFDGFLFINGSDSCLLAFGEVTRFLGERILYLWIVLFTVFTRAETSPIELVSI